ncbi:MAG: hypothetical protein QOK28_1302 [Actinomycetota bacterium]
MPFTLGRRPALDGIRGFAVLAVLAFHSGLDAKGGHLGVQVFFVLSGFVITAVLLEEANQTGRVSLRQFYARRVLRLLPALVAVLAFVSVYSLLSPAKAPRHEVARAGAGALFYVANWVFEHFGDKPYLLLHTWSLSVEEQFYLLWPPIVVVLAIRRGGYRALLRVALLGAVASGALRWLLIERGANLDRIYLGTDTRVDALLIGCALAVMFYAGWFPSGARARSAVRVAGTVGALAVVVACVFWSRPDVVAVGGIGLTLFALASGAIIATAVDAPDRAMARILAWSPLVQLGKISYGLYLWHLPLFVVMRHAFPTTPNIVMIPVMTAVALAVSIASYRFIEEPFLRMKDRFRPAPQRVDAAA